MTTIKNILRLSIIIFLLIIGLNSCCKDQIYARLEIKFQHFDLSTLDSVLLIETDRNNISQHPDTIYCNFRTVVSLSKIQPIV
jgi:hypothetical protein